MVNALFSFCDLVPVSACVHARMCACVYWVCVRLKPTATLKKTFSVTYSFTNQTVAHDECKFISSLSQLMY